VSSDGYDHMVGLVTEILTLKTRELAELATDDGLDTDKVGVWLDSPRWIHRIFGEGLVYQ